MADPVISPPEVTFTSPLEHSRRQLEALLEVSEAIAQQRDLPALFHDLAGRLHSVVDFDFLTLVLLKRASPAKSPPAVSLPSRATPPVGSGKRSKLLWSATPKRRRDSPIF